MEFSTKLQMLRKEKGLSQEALADQLNVSRQAVSKWESGNGYPETDKIIMISEFFDVSLDYLMKDQSEPVISDKESQYFMTSQKIKDYLSKKRIFGLKLASLVSMIIFATMIPLFCDGQSYETIGNVLWLVIVGLCVALLIVTAISNEGLEKLEKKNINMSYGDQVELQNKYMKFKQRFGISIAVGVFLIIVSVASGYLIDEYTHNEVLVGVVLFICVGVAVFIFINQGVKDGAYRFLVQNKEYVKEVKKSDNSVFGITMPLAAMIFLVLGFTKGLWHPGWLVFPITAIISVGIDKFINSDD